MRSMGLFFCLLTLFWTSTVSGGTSDERPVTAKELAAIRQLLEEQGRRIAELEAQNRALRETLANLQLNAPSVGTNGVVASSGMGVVGLNGRSASEKVISSLPPDASTAEKAAAALFSPLTERGVRLKPYGYIKMDVVHNTHKTDGDDYSFYVRPPWERGSGTHETTLSLRESRLGMDMIVPETEEGLKVDGKFEIDFYQGSVSAPSPRLRHVYVNLGFGDTGWSFLAGQTYDAWWVLCPFMLDGGWGGGMGHPYHRRPQLRLAKEHTFRDGSKLTARIATVQNAGTDLDGDKIDDGSASAWPMVQGALIWTKKNWTGDEMLLSLSGSYGRERLTEDEHEEGNGTYDTTMAMVNARLPLFSDLAFFPICKKLAVRGSLYAGENMDTYKAGIVQGINRVQGTEIGALGGWVESNLKVTDRLDLNVGYCFEDDANEDLEWHDRTRNSRYYINGYYQLSKHVKMALEYGRITTDFVDAKSAENDQFHFAMYYHF